MRTRDLEEHVVTDAEGKLRTFQLTEFTFDSGEVSYGWYGKGEDEDAAEFCPHQTLDSVRGEIRAYVAGEEPDIMEMLLGSGMIVPHED